MPLGAWPPAITPKGPGRREGEIGELAGAFNVTSASLEGTERRRVQLVGDVAHELRTPLTTLDGYLEGLQDGMIEPTDETWNLLRRETERLMRLVGDLAELWRAEARQLPLRVEAVEVEGMVADALDRFTPTAVERRLRFETDVTSGTTVFADRDRLVQILGNYLSNAIRHAPSGTAIRVGARREGTDVHLSVSDEGAGLSPEQRAQVFERFYRLDASRSRDEGGAGIGLSIVRALAEAMDGRAGAESAGPGRGSTFFVGLLAAAPA